MTSRSSPLIVAAVSAIIVFGIPLMVASAMVERDPEIRVIRTGDSFSALIVTDAVRALVVNSTDQRVTRSSIGLLARPWEPDPSLLIASADDRAAVGLWEAMKHPAVEQVFVVGLPGAEPIWTEIEREGRTRNIEIVYIAETSVIDMEPLTLTVTPQSSDSSPSISVRRGNTLVGYALNTDSPNVQSNVAVLNAIPDRKVPSDLVIVFRNPGQQMNGHTIVAGSREVIRLLLGVDEVRARGGRLFLVDSSTH